eukprot:jgi/Mesvir1/22825/Mv20087-RA.1
MTCFAWRNLWRHIFVLAAVCLVVIPCECLVGPRAWGSELAMVDAVRTFCRCADSLPSHRVEPEKLYKQELHATDNPVEKLLAGMVTSLGIRSGAQIRAFCRDETARLSAISGGVEGNCTGLFHMPIFSKSILSVVSLTMCRRGWVYWDMRKPRPDSIPGIADCADSAPRLLWTRAWLYDLNRGYNGHTFDLFNELVINKVLGDKGLMYEIMVRGAAEKSPKCLDSLSALLPKTYRLYDPQECKQFFASELIGAAPPCDQGIARAGAVPLSGTADSPAQAGRGPGDSTLDSQQDAEARPPCSLSGLDTPAAPAGNIQAAVPSPACLDPVNETWWLIKLTDEYKCTGHGIVIPSIHSKLTAVDSVPPPGCVGAGCPSDPTAPNAPHGGTNPGASKTAGASNAVGARLKGKPGGAQDSNRLHAYGPAGENCDRIGEVNAGKKEIATRYIRPPLLIEGRKFHVRSYAGLASSDPLTVFFHRGYVKVGQQAYDDSKERSGDALRHFTNMPNPNTNSADVLWTYEDFEWYLSSVVRRVEPGYVNATMVPLFKRVTVFALRLLHEALPAGHQGFYQEYSFDFMFGDDLRIYLIEVNTNTGCIFKDPTFWKSFMNAFEDLRIAREAGVWPREEPGAMLPDGMDIGTLELLMYKDWDTGSLEGCD